MIVDDSAGPWYGYGEMTAQSFPPRLITLNRWRTIPRAGLQLSGQSRELIIHGSLVRIQSSSQTRTATTTTPDTLFH